MNYEIRVKQLPAQVVVTERCHATLAELGDTMHATLAKVALSVEPAGAARGAPFAVYYNEPFRPEDIDVELGVSVTPRAKVAETKGVHRRELAGGPVAYTVHVGPYATIGAAYEALYAWVGDHGLHRTGPPREIYFVGPAQGARPEDYRTEIDVPIDGSRP
ncbi:MAG: GyrI-like domain-containing protein [Labilithrix sp.]|nr:GyrI-like domain-containing protein [Labilithrix sp.]